MVSSYAAKKNDYNFRTFLGNNMFLMDVFALLTGFSFLGVFRPDIVMIFAMFMVPAYIVITSRTKRLLYLLISFLQASVWLLLSKDYYGYSVHMLRIGGISLFPLFGWTLGLFAFYNLYLDLRSEDSVFLNDLIIFSLFFWIIFITAETIGYHKFGIRNAATQNYPGLPLCDCIHLPLSMQIMYLMMGPAYFVLVKVFETFFPYALRRCSVLYDRVINFKFD